MQKNKVTTYLPYAIGEIFLVVIGILIAVSIDSWVVSLKNSDLEAKYLALIREELSNNIQFIDNHYMARYEKKLAALETIRAYHQGKYVIHDSLLFVTNMGYGAVFGTRTFRGGSVAFEEIVSTGRLSIIKEDSLRRSLINYYSSVVASLQALEEYKSGYLQTVNSLRPFNPNNPDNLDPFDIQLMIDKAKTEEFYLAVTSEITFAHQTMEYMMHFKTEAVKIIQMIDLYLAKS